MIPLDDKKTIVNVKAFFLALRAGTSIIKHSGRISFEAATALFVIS
jgi:hypothetical protein